MSCAQPVPARLVIAVGDKHVIRLDGLGSAGYRWTQRVDGDPHVVTVTVELGQIDAALATTPGVSAQEIVTIAALRPGEVTVRLSQARAWEKSAKPLCELAIQVIVNN